jgi:hypothetical protein
MRLCIPALLFTLVMAPQSYGLVIEGELILRADVDGSTIVDMTDAVKLQEFLFLGGYTPPCEDASDANDDGWVDTTDVIHLLDYLFLGNKVIPSPGALECGEDLTPDDLTCNTPVCFEEGGGSY